MVITIGSPKIPFIIVITRESQGEQNGTNEIEHFYEEIQFFCSSQNQKYCDLNLIGLLIDSFLHFW